MECDCIQNLLSYVKTGEYPIELSEFRGEFVIRGRSETRFIVIRYCPFCGSKLQLPATAKWADFDERELDEARGRVESCRSKASLVAVLGEPDDVLSLDAMSAIEEPGRSIDCVLVFSRQWQSFDLLVRITGDKRVDCMFRPKRLS